MVIRFTAQWKNVSRFGSHPLFRAAKISKNPLFLSKIQMLVKYPNFYQTSKLLWHKNTFRIFVKKIKMSVKNQNFSQESKFLSTIQIFIKNPKLFQNSKFLWKIQIVIKTQNICQKSNVFFFKNQCEIWAYPSLLIIFKRNFKPFFKSKFLKI